MYKDPIPRDRINSYAVVAYIPEPLAGFLDRLRQELVPNCCLKAHVTILPPRPLTTSPEDAWNMLSGMIPSFSPFAIELARIEVFPVSDVIYIDIGAGNESLVRMHATLNRNGLFCKEQFDYEPHVTLAQDLKPDELDELITVARDRWREYPGDKTFVVEKVVFVQNTLHNDWVNLGECTLGQSDSRLVGEFFDSLIG